MKFFWRWARQIAVMGALCAVGCPSAAAYTDWNGGAGAEYLAVRRDGIYSGCEANINEKHVNLALSPTFQLRQLDGGLTAIGTGNLPGSEVTATKPSAYQGTLDLNLHRQQGPHQLRLQGGLDYANQGLLVCTEDVERTLARRQRIQNHFEVAGNQSRSSRATATYLYDRGGPNFNLTLQSRTQVADGEHDFLDATGLFLDQSWPRLTYRAGVHTAIDTYLGETINRTGVLGDVGGTVSGVNRWLIAGSADQGDSHQEARTVSASAGRHLTGATDLGLRLEQRRIVRSPEPSSLTGEVTLAVDEVQTRSELLLGRTEMDDAAHSQGNRIAVSFTWSPTRLIRWNSTAAHGTASVAQARSLDAVTSRLDWDLGLPRRSLQRVGLYLALAGNRLTEASGNRTTARSLTIGVGMAL